MNDRELDRRLARTPRATDNDAVAKKLLDQLVLDSRESVRARRRPSFRSRIALGAGGFMLAGALVAGVTYQDYLLSIPPFAGLMDGEQRTTSGLTMTQEHGPDAGKQCVMYPEFRNLTSDQFTAISNYVANEKSWDSLGSDAARLAGLQPGEAEEKAVFAYYDAITVLVHERVQQVLPGIPFRARFNVEGGLEADPPSFEGWTISCLPGEAATQ